MYDLPHTTEAHEAISSVIWKELGVKTNLPRTANDCIVSFTVDGEHFGVLITPERDLKPRPGDVWVAGEFRWNGRWRLELTHSSCQYGGCYRPTPAKVPEAARELAKRVRGWMEWKKAVTGGRANIRIAVDNTKQAKES